MEREVKRRRSAAHFASDVANANVRSHSKLKPCDWCQTVKSGFNSLVSVWAAAIQRCSTSLWLCVCVFGCVWMCVHTNKHIQTPKLLFLCRVHYHRQRSQCLFVCAKKIWPSLAMFFWIYSATTTNTLFSYVCCVASLMMHDGQQQQQQLPLQFTWLPSPLIHSLFLFCCLSVVAQK